MLGRRLAAAHRDEARDLDTIDRREKIGEGRPGKLCGVRCAREQRKGGIGVEDPSVADETETLGGLVYQQLQAGVRNALVLGSLPPIGRVAHHAEQEPFAAHLDGRGADLHRKDAAVAAAVTGLEEDSVVLGPLDLALHLGQGGRIAQVADLELHQLLARISIGPHRGAVGVDDPAVPGEHEDDVARVIEQRAAARLQRLELAAVADVAHDDHVRVDPLEGERGAERLDVEGRSVLAAVPHARSRHLPRALEDARARRLVDETELARVLRRVELPGVHLLELLARVPVLEEEGLVGRDDAQRLQVVDEDRLRIRLEQMAEPVLGAHREVGHSKTAVRAHGRRSRAAAPPLIDFVAMDRLQARVAKLGRILEVAKALVAERDLDRLLKLIVQAAARVVEADRCSLFLVDKAKGELWSKIAQGVGTREIRFPMGRGIAGTVAETNTPINIADAYDDPRFNPDVDKETGYRTKSILCVPMRSLEGEVVGVLQALNKILGGTFTEEDEELLSALGGQAAVAVNNALVNQEIAQLFEGFVRASVVAIESRDPTTAGHSDRVARLSVGLADVLPSAGHTAGRWKDFRLGNDERQELRYAALLHDFGKVGVRENVLVKANKLEPGELETLRARFEMVLAHAEIEAEKRKVQRLVQHPREAPRIIAEEDARLADRRRELDGMFQFILGCNLPTVMEEGTFDRLFEIGNVQYTSPVTQKVQPFLTEGEILKLSVRKGSLTELERREIESHVTHTYRFLQQIPWTRALRRVPDIAYGHHEKLGGGGYPRSLTDPDISLPTRMMTISDIYDALTASDRPYKKAVPKEKAYEILEDEAKRGDVDSDLLGVFIEADIPARLKSEED